MKKLSTIFLVSILSLLMLCMSVSTVFADEVATINGEEVAVGSSVTYTFNISDAQQKLTGIHMIIFFDQELLTLESVNTDNLPGSTVNDNQNGKGQVIVVNPFVNGASGLECKEKTELVSVTFKVAAAGDTEISYYIPYLYDFDSVNFYDYTLTCDLAAGEEVIAADETPILADVDSIDGFDRGDFANNVEGTGSGVKPVVTAAAGNAQDGNGDNSQSGGGESGSMGSGTVVAIVCGGILVAGVVALIVVKSISGKKSEESKEPWE